MTAKGWGLKANIIKMWYTTVVEKTLTYAAPIWGHQMDRRNKEILSTCQRS